MSRVDLTGQRVGRLMVLAGAGLNKHSKALWRCACDCGASTTAVAGDLRSGRTRSCGCLSRELSLQRLSARNTRHGMRGSPEYSVWQSMLSRCYNENVEHYPDYGGRGIKVCDRWRSDFAAFRADMGSRPAGLTLERENTNGDYEPGNCRWATQKEQQNNRRSNVRIEFNGESLTLRQWEERLGLSRGTMRQRLAAGWSAADAVTKRSQLKK